MKNWTQQANLSQDQKHASAVAKIHYQKRKSEDMSAKVKKIMDKLPGKSESSSVINLINFGTESSATSSVLMIAQKLEHFLLTAYALKKYLSQKWKTVF